MSEVINPAAMVAMLEILPGCPPDFCAALCANSQQTTEFLQWKHFYTDLNHLLTCYFTGQSPPKYMNLEYGEMLHLDMSELLRFYDLIFAGWEFLEFDREGLNPSAIFKDIIWRQAAHAFLQCTASWSEYSPQGDRKDLKFLNDYIRSVASGKDSGIQAAKYKRYKTKKKNQEVRHDLRDVERYCWLTLKQLKKPPIYVKNALKAYEGAIENKKQWALSRIHPRKGAIGFRIIGGVKTRNGM